MALRESIFLRTARLSKKDTRMNIYRKNKKNAGLFLLD